jgi:PAS domain S-box-containing protein
MKTDKTKAVVVVHDEPVQRRLLAGLMESAGYEVLSCPDAIEAMALLERTGPPLLVITDLHMPGIDGWRFCRLLRSPEYAAFNKVPIIVVSATYTRNAVQSITSELGADAFMQAPYDAAQLRSVVQTVLRGGKWLSLAKVLIVDDNQNTLELLSGIFEKGGYRIELAASGEAGLSRYEETLPDLVLLDYHLPDMSGDKVLEGILKKHPDAVVIIITGDPRRTLAIELLSRGAAAWLKKPFQPEHVLKLCRQVLGEHALLNIQDRLMERTVKLNASEERYRQLFAEMVSGFVLHEVVRDAHGAPVDYRYLDVNPAFENLTGLKRETVIGRTVLEVLPNTDTALLQSYAQVAQTGKPAAFEYHSKELEKDFSIVTFSPSPGRLGITFNNITEKKRLEIQFLRAQRMESVGILASGIAHDLNNVLSPILLSVQLLRELVSDDTAKSILTTLETTAQRGAGIVKQVLGFARGIEGERRLIQPKHLVREMADLARQTFPKSITVTLDCPNEMPTLLGDPTQLHQVLLNLCVNARDAMPHGGCLSMAIETVEIDESYMQMHPFAKTGSHVMITIADTGCGIPSSVRERIFEPFFTTKPEGEGTGLGLVTALSLVKKHGGFMGVESQENRGACFKIYLPAQANAGPIRTGAESQAAPKGDGEWVLVVEDEPSIRQVTRCTLERNGYRVLAAGDGTEALALFAQKRADISVVVTDMIMPFMDGAATIRAIRRLSSHIPIIAVSGALEKDQDNKAINANAQAFLSKPYTALQLLLLLRQVLDESKFKPSAR